MQKITPHLWYDKEAKEAAEFYVSAFRQLGEVYGESKVQSVTVLHDTPSGDCDVVSFKLAGQDFMAISAGPLFKFNPSISFHVKCKTKEQVDSMWEKFSDGGKVLMELGEYPFSERYGWIQDKYGLSWQIIFTSGEIKQAITPVIMYVQDVAGKAEEAINLYTSIFKNSKINFIARYEKGEPDKEGTIKYASFVLEEKEFGAMDSSAEHKFTFNEAISLIVKCENQEEIDYYWEKLAADPKGGQCGWTKDKYGVSWQITPSILGEMLEDEDKEKVSRVTEAFLKMKKFDIAKLKEAYERNS